MIILSKNQCNNERITSNVETQTYFIQEHTATKKIITAQANTGTRATTKVIKKSQDHT